MSNYLTLQEGSTAAERQIFSLENNLSKGLCSLNEVGIFVPGAIMVQDFNQLKVTYMNDWGCEKLNYSMDEINDMGEAYFAKFFKPEQSNSFKSGMIDLFLRKDTTEIYSFFHQVLIKNTEWNWYYGIVKFLRTDTTENSGELIVVAHPVSGLGNMVGKVAKTLDENEYVIKHYQKFALLSKREKEIVKLLTYGKSNSEISDFLSISKHTVKTHRKNIIRKINTSSFAELVRFAVAFDLI